MFWLSNARTLCRFVIPAGPSFVVGWPHFITCPRRILCSVGFRRPIRKSRQPIEAHFDHQYAFTLPLFKGLVTRFCATAPPGGPHMRRQGNRPWVDKVFHIGILDSRVVPSPRSQPEFDAVGRPAAVDIASVKSNVARIRSSGDEPGDGSGVVAGVGQRRHVRVGDLDSPEPHVMRELVNGNGDVWRSRGCAAQTPHLNRGHLRLPARRCSHIRRGEFSVRRRRLNHDCVTVVRRPLSNIELKSTSSSVQ